MNLTLVCTSATKSGGTQVWTLMTSARMPRTQSTAMILWWQKICALSIFTIQCSSQNTLETRAQTGLMTLALGSLMKTWSSCWSAAGISQSLEVTWTVLSAVKCQLNQSYFARPVTMMLIPTTRLMWDSNLMTSKTHPCKISAKDTVWFLLKCLLPNPKMR